MATEINLAPAPRSCSVTREGDLVVLFWIDARGEGWRFPLPPKSAEAIGEALIETAAEGAAEPEETPPDE